MKVLGKIAYGIGYVIVRIGVVFMNFGFKTAGISQEKAADILSSMWPVEWSIKAPVKKYSELQSTGNFVRAQSDEGIC